MSTELERVRSTEILTARTEHALAVELSRMVRRGELAAASQVRPIRGGGYAVKVRLIPEPRRRPRWPYVLVGILGFLGVTALLLWLITKLLSALVALLPFALGAAALLAAAAVLGGGSTIEVIQRVTIKK